MKTFAAVAVLFATTAGLGTPAAAQVYGEVSYLTTRLRTVESGLELKSSPSALRGIIGYTLNPNLGVEAMLVTGLSSDTVKVNGFTAPGTSADVDHGLGFYLRPGVKLAERVELFGRAGIARVKGTIAIAGFGSVSDSDTSFSFGAGLAYHVNPRARITADFMQYLNKDGFKANGYAIGLGFSF